MAVLWSVALTLLPAMQTNLPTVLQGLYCQYRPVTMSPIGYSEGHGQLPFPSPQNT